ncbi:MAG: prepilin-type N-terminal cleavage/methylation domain-containing protein, partial [Candidatus Pacebacteria bacterium]|nr:prepilin-type N-terminal cleavage/methylation domain-containing protein [Candidatus Paceibacterota bacterium]
MKRRAFTLIELIIVIAIIGILAAFIIANLGGSRSAAYDSVRKNDIANIYKSIVGKKTLNESGYYEGTAAIKEGETPGTLQSYIDQFLKTTPYDPNPAKAYLYTSD